MEVPWWDSSGIHGRGSLVCRSRCFYEKVPSSPSWALAELLTAHKSHSDVLAVLRLPVLTASRMSRRTRRTLQDTVQADRSVVHWSSCLHQRSSGSILQSLLQRSPTRHVLPQLGSRRLSCCGSKPDNGDCNFSSKWTFYPNSHPAG